MRQVTRMGNKSGAGPFTPVVVVVRNAMGKKEFNQFRGKAISLHSQGVAPRLLQPAFLHANVSTVHHDIYCAL